MSRQGGDEASGDPGGRQSRRNPPDGREKLHFINPVPIHEIAARWIRKFETGRLAALSALKKALEEKD
jgi:hypothetical protein